MKFYRYEVVHYATGRDIDGEYTGHSTPILECHEYDLIKETPKGYQIGYSFLNRPYKWIPKVSKKKYAYLTKEEALNNYIKRTERRLKILKTQIESCKDGLYLANKILTDDKLF
jgi:hypothetical protein